MDILGPGPVRFRHGQQLPSSVITINPGSTRDGFTQKPPTVVVLPRQNLSGGLRFSGTGGGGGDHLPGAVVPVPGDRTGPRQSGDPAVTVAADHRHIRGTVT